MLFRSHITVDDRAIEENGGVIVRYHVVCLSNSEGEKIELPVPQNSAIYDKLEQINAEIKAAKKAAKEAAN